MSDINSTEGNSAQILNKSVAIRTKAFLNCERLIGLNGCTISSVGDQSFSGCAALTAVPMSDPTAIGKDAFSGCNSLQSVDLGAELTSVSESSFKNCGRLAAVNGGSALKNVDDEAFRNSPVTNIDIFRSPPVMLDTTGHHSFAGTNFDNPYLSLRSSSTYTYWGDYCFEGCQKLTTVHITDSCFMSTGMFRNCTALTSVLFESDNQNYVYPSVFEGCTALASITLPSQIWFITKNMFKGCAKLTSVGFKTLPEGKTAYGLERVEEAAFDGCQNLKTMTFPASLTDFSMFKDACLSGASLNYITFDGIQSPLITHNIPYDIYRGHIMVNGNHFWGSYIYDAFTDIIETFKNKSTSDEDWSPYIIIVTNPDIQTYTEADGWYYKQLSRVYTKEQRISNNAIVMIIFDDLGGTKTREGTDTKYLPYDDFTAANIKKLALNVGKDRKNGKLSDPISQIRSYLVNVSGNSKYKFGIYEQSTQQSSDLANYCHMAAIRVSKSKVQVLDPITDVTNFNKVKKCIEQVWNIPKQETYDCLVKKSYWGDDITKTGLFRLRKNCYLKFKNETEFKLFTYNSDEEEKYVPSKEIPIDKETTWDFQPGKWYYNSIKIKEYADATHIPLMLMFSQRGCQPCQRYAESIFLNDDFQAWAAKQKFLMCRIEAENIGSDKYYRYAAQDFATYAMNFDKIGQSRGIKNAYDQHFMEKQDAAGNINSTLPPPAIVFYYNDGAATVTKFYDYSLHSIKSMLDTPEIGVAGLMQWQKSLCLYHFDNNTLAGAQWTVDAVKPFNKYDYIIDPENPYKIGDNLITLNRWADLATKTPAAAVEKMNQIIVTASKAAGSESKDYPYYIGGCLWGDIDWIEVTYDTVALEDAGEDATAINAELGRYGVQIGDKTYTFYVDASTKTSRPIETPCGESYLYKYGFKEEYTPPVVQTYQIYVLYEPYYHGESHGQYQLSSVQQRVRLDTDTGATWQASIEGDCASRAGEITFDNDGHDLVIIPAGIYGNITLSKTQPGKKYAILAGYSSSSKDDAMNGVEAERLKNEILTGFNRVECMYGDYVKPTATKVINKIKELVEAATTDDFLFIYLSGHGSRYTSGSKSYTKIAFYNSTVLTGKSLWSALDGAKCKIFLLIHTCSAGHFFSSPSLSSEQGRVESVGFIQEAREYFTAKAAENGAFAASSGEPAMLLWSSSAADEYSWMASTYEATSDKVWYDLFGMTGTGIGVSFYKNYAAQKTYSQIWTEMTTIDASLPYTSRPACRLNQAWVPGSSYYGKSQYMDNGPTPLKDAFGGFDESKPIFT